VGILPGVLPDEGFGWNGVPGRASRAAGLTGRRVRSGPPPRCHIVIMAFANTFGDIVMAGIGAESDDPMAAEAAGEEEAQGFNAPESHVNRHGQR